VFSFALPLAAAAVPTLASSTAQAEERAPAPRAAFSGTFQRYLLQPNGHVLGLMLSDGSFIATPGHALNKDAPTLTTGTKLDIEGVQVRTPTGVLVHRAVVKVNGAVIADASSGHDHGRHGHGGGEGREHHARHELSPQTGTGQIAAIVAGPKGRIRALVLTDGTTAVGHNLEGFGLKVGDRVTVIGRGGVYPLGKALHVEKITLPNGQTRDVPRPDQAPSGGPA
jgi:hypothetical protein